MPSTSQAQARLMAAAAHTPGGYDGVPQKAGRDLAKLPKRKTRAQKLYGDHHG